MQSFVLEVILTLILIWVILSVSTGAKEKGITAGIAVGAVIALEALVAMKLESLWIYLTAPVIGALLAVPLCMCVRGAGCCTSPLSRGYVPPQPEEPTP